MILLYLVVLNLHLVYVEFIHTSVCTMAVRLVLKYATKL